MRRLLSLVPAAAVFFAASSACHSSTSPTQVDTLTATHPTLDSVYQIPIGTTTYGVAVRGDVFAVTGLLANELFFGRVSLRAITDSAAVGSVPAHVALDNAGRAYTTDQYGNAVSVVDIASDMDVQDAPLPSGGFNLLFDQPAERLYVTTANGELVDFSLPSMEALDTLQLGTAANGLALNAVAHVLYVSSRDAGEVYAINTDADTVLRTYTVGGLPQRLALARGGDFLFVANEYVGVQKLNLANGTITAIPMYGGGYGLAISPDSEQVYSTSPGTGRFYVISVASEAIVDSAIVGGTPRNIAFDATGRSAFVTNEGGWVNFIR